MNHLIPLLDGLINGEVNLDLPNIKVYHQSFTQFEDVSMLMVKDESAKWILTAGKGQLFDDLEGSIIQEDKKICPLTHQNRLVLNKYFDYTVPQAFGTKSVTIGLGDRLGLATPGHIEAVNGKQIKPIFAQQSIRELTLTGRSVDDVLDDVCFAVFQEGYKGGFGADGDHLKKESDIQSSLAHGMSMLTLDCTDQIRLEIEDATLEQIEAEYNALPQNIQDHFNQQYLNKTFELNGLSITFDKNSLMKNVLIYKEAVSYMIHVYNNYIKNVGREIDFEVSIDETTTTTTPLTHFFVANELHLADVKVTSLAPRFCGEFQKGIDYIGDLTQFEHDLIEHVLIAKHFGYKLSIHSGSDKFSVFPQIAKHTDGIFHIKTAGTNWLEAVRVIAETNPELYRRMHKYAFEHFEEALQYYHVTPDLHAIKELDSVIDNELSSFMNDNNARQVFHVTYGILLQAKDENGQYIFKDEFFATLFEREAEYRNALSYHIGKHLEYLAIK
jgi:tagaturonate epimerase